MVSSHGADGGLKGAVARECNVAVASSSSSSLTVAPLKALSFDDVSDTATKV